MTSQILLLVHKWSPNKLEVRLLFQDILSLCKIHLQVTMKNCPQVLAKLLNN